MISKTQRNILLACATQFLIGLGFFYYSDFWYLGLITIVSINLFVAKKLILNRSLGQIWPKTVRPSLWLFLAFFYLYLVRNINNYTLVFFLPVAISFIVGYGFIFRYEVGAKSRSGFDGAVSLLLIILSVTISSLVQVLWHWPIFFVLAGVWLVSFVIALWWLLPFMGRLEGVAAIWALVTVELVWVMSRWLVLYQLPRLKFIISQPSLLVASLAYSWGGMYYHHKKGTLTRPLLFEYLAVSSIVFILLVVLTKWTAGF